MARIRKRVYATRRAPDGSAFQKCIRCETLVPIALEDMHECDVEKEDTEIKSNQRDSFVKSNNDNQIEDDLEGFNKWRNMSERGKLRFVLEAEKVNSAYTKALLREAENMSSWVNDEVDSAEVGKYDEGAITGLCYYEKLKMDDVLGDTTGHKRIELWRGLF